MEALIGYLRGTHLGVSRSWLDLDCILFSQYCDTVRWIGDELARRAEFSGMEIGLYAGSNRSGVWREGRFQRCGREVLKARVRAGELKLLLGTDAASEGLNLQRLGSVWPKSKTNICINVLECVLRNEDSDAIRIC